MIQIKKYIKPIAIAGSLSLAGLIGYCANDIDDRTECAYQKTATITDAVGNSDVALERNAQMKQITEIYSANGYCDFKFKELVEK